MNGLILTNGGTHVDIVTNNLVNVIRAKLIKKYKTIKPADIKNKLFVISILKDFNGPKYETQTKEKLTNSVKQVQEYYNNNFDYLINKVIKNKDIIDSITDYFKIKEEFKKQQELKNLNKNVKKIKSEKYMPATGIKKYLMITEGASATGGLMPVLGRKDVGFYELKGKPLNAYKASQSDFAKNKELSELYKIIQNEGYQYIIEATDQDLDGFHIRGLLNGFIHRYLPEYKNKVGYLDTPVIGVKKGKKLQRWYYSLNDKVLQKSGEISKYYKGLGSWKESDLKYIVQNDGIKKMIKMYDWDSNEIIDDWLNEKKADKRKEYIQNNNFSIAKI